MRFLQKFFKQLGLIDNNDKLFLIYKKGEGTVIPKAIQHKPQSENCSLILLPEPQQVKTTDN